MIELKNESSGARRSVQIGSAVVGRGRPVLIAGPCAVESSYVGQAEELAGSGIDALRACIYKPRTHPDSFQGMGRDAVPLLDEARRRTGLPLVSEVLSAEDAEAIGDHVDAYQVGARNMQNFVLLKEVGQAKKPVLLKRGMSATVKDMLMSAEYILAEGNKDVVLCERGVRSFEDSTRNMLDMSAVPNVKGQSHLPIIVDPSHATGRPDLIPSMA